MITVQSERPDLRAVPLRDHRIGGAEVDPRGHVHSLSGISVTPCVPTIRSTRGTHLSFLPCSPCSVSLTWPLDTNVPMLASTYAGWTTRTQLPSSSGLRTVNQSLV